MYFTLKIFDVVFHRCKPVLDFILDVLACFKCGHGRDRQKRPLGRRHKWAFGHWFWDLKELDRLTELFCLWFGKWWAVLGVVICHLMLLKRCDLYGALFLDESVKQFEFVFALAERWTWTAQHRWERMVRRSCEVWLISLFKQQTGVFFQQKLVHVSKIKDVVGLKMRGEFFAHLHVGVEPLLVDFLGCFLLLVAKDVMRKDLGLYLWWVEKDFPFLLLACDMLTTTFWFGLWLESIPGPEVWNRVLINCFAADKFIVEMLAEFVSTMFAMSLRSNFCWTGPWVGSLKLLIFIRIDTQRKH